MKQSTQWLSPTVYLRTLEADLKGPWALIQAGIHGDEIAGVHAIEELLEEKLSPKRGKITFCPVMNPGAYRIQQRTCEGGLDLNRQFPGDEHSQYYESRLAAYFMGWVLKNRPDLVATLHESNKRYDVQVVPSFGQTLVYGVKPTPSVVSDVVAKLNENASPEETWNTLYYPVETSSTERIVEATGCTGICVETWKGFSLARRVQMQKEVVLHLLRSFDLID